MNMIEKVALALFESYQQDNPEAKFAGGAKSYFIKRSRIAIEAMREPTDWMMICGAAIMPEHDEPTNDDAGETWNAMIVAALDGPPPAASK